MKGNIIKRVFRWILCHILRMHSYRDDWVPTIFYNRAGMPWRGATAKCKYCPHWYKL